MSQYRVHIETLKNPYVYSQKQIDFACLVAAMLNRGKLVLCEAPQEEKA